MSEKVRDLKVKEIVVQTHIIEKLLDLLDKYVMTVKKCFKGDTFFERQRYSAFE